MLLLGVVERGEKVLLGTDDQGVVGWVGLGCVGCERDKKKGWGSNAGFKLGSYQNVRTRCTRTRTHTHRFRGIMGRGGT